MLLPPIWPEHGHGGGWRAALEPFLAAPSHPGEGSSVTVSAEAGEGRVLRRRACIGMVLSPGPGKRRGYMSMGWGSKAEGRARRICRSGLPAPVGTVLVP